MQDPEDTIHSPCDECGSQYNHQMVATFHLVTDRRLQLLSHIARSSPQEDHHCAIAVMIWKLPPSWKQPLGRPIQTWFRAVEANQGQLNIGLASAISNNWLLCIVDTAALQRKKEESKMEEKIRIRCLVFVFCLFFNEPTRHHLCGEQMFRRGLSGSVLLAVRRGFRKGRVRMDPRKSSKLLEF